MSRDREFMGMALKLAAKGAGYVSPNPMVGAVVVKDGQVVGAGYHEAVGRAHAEVNALDDAGDKARGATLYVTLEPCNHTGRTPPCTEKILRAGVRSVVVAMADPNPHVTGGGNRRLQAEGIDVVTGVCEPEARALNESFIKYIRTKNPFVILKCAATLDGRIATRTGDAKWVTGPASRQFVHQIRHAVDGILVGIGTVKADDPSLTTRLDGGEGRDPVRVILDTHLAISDTAKVLRQQSDSDTVIVCGPAASAEKSARLTAEKGVQVIHVPLKDDVIDLGRLMPHLGALGITSLLVEGGARVMASMIASDIADKALFFYAPKILGGDDGFPICRGSGPEKMADCAALRDIRIRRFDDDVMIEGYFRR